MELLMEATDGNDNEYLDYGAFVAVTIHLKRLSNDAHLRTAFLFFDKDSSGYIEPRSPPRSPMRPATPTTPHSTRPPGGRHQQGWADKLRGIHGDDEGRKEEGITAVLAAALLIHRAREKEATTPSAITSLQLTSTCSTRPGAWSTPSP
ncbi:hypothetical protein ACP70R_023719 [Stipagrostis hirtigluma subsp. patula]